MPVRIKAVIFLSLGFFFIFASSVFASEVSITTHPNSVTRLEEFDVSLSGSQLESNTEYYLKARVGKEGEMPNKGETYNPSSGNWLHDSSSWVDFPTGTTGSTGVLTTTIRVRTKDTAETGVNKLTVRIRQVGSASNIDSQPVDIEIKEGLSPSPSPLPSPSPSLSPTTATYKINEVKDENGNLLSSVKVYLDGTYLHHYAPETLTFCDGCQCDAYVNCGFGEHTIKLEKSDYENWEETKTINAGDTYEVNPVMSQTDSDSTSASSPTPSLTPSPEPVAVSGATLLGKILGEEETSPAGFFPWEATEGAESQEATEASRPKFIPKLFLGLGLVFLAAAGFYIWYTKLRW